MRGIGFIIAYGLIARMIGSWRHSRVLPVFR